MGAFLDKPKTEKYNESNEGSGLKYGLSSMQGWRIEMEDAHTALIGLPQLGENVSWFAVFDGHAGSRVSSHCANHLLNCISSHKNFSTTILNEASLSQEQFLDEVKSAILKGFLELDEKLRKIPEVANGEDKSGTTAVCALVTGKFILFSNCGDSRALLCRNGQPILATMDHKPSNAPERERIQNAGGSVMIQRVNGSLAVSRALGDFEYKNVVGKGPTEQLVSPEPEFFITEKSLEDEFLVLACDGVWDVMSNDDLCNFIRYKMAIIEDLEIIANDIIDTCLYKGSRDNMSIIIIAFPGALKPNEEALATEEKLNTKIRNKVAEVVEQMSGANQNIDFGEIFQRVQEDITEDLPPGGLFSKRSFMEGLYKTHSPQGTLKGEEHCPNPIASMLFTNANQTPISNDK